MEIEKKHILETIEKMIAAGKSLPQKDRIKYAKDQAEEQQKVLAETVNLWWELFSKRHIGVDLWSKATDRALMISGIPKLDTAIINPALMSVAVEQELKAYLEAQQVKHEQEKKVENNIAPSNFPEMGKLVVYHMKRHRRPFIKLPEPDDVYRRIGNRMTQEDISNNMLPLRVYLCYWDYSRRDKEKMPVELVRRSNGMLGIDFIEN